MQRLRTTFTRSRTPTPADMKTQSSLEVPKQVRSASFDEIQLEAARGAGGGASPSSVRLAVPQQGARSCSFDSAGSDDSGTYLEVPRLWSRRRSGKGTPPPCVHCRHMETWLARRSEERTTPDRPAFSSSAEDDDDSDTEAPRVLLAPPPPPRTCLPPPPTSPPPALTIGPPSFELQPPADEPPVPPARRRSISRQEAFFVEPTGTSLENVRASEETAASGTSGALVHDIYLAVPDMRRDRAASVDSCFSKVSGARAEELSGGGDSLSVPSAGLRSRSVDIVLPTAEQARYKALALSSPQAQAQAGAPPHQQRRDQEEVAQPTSDSRSVA